MRPTLSLLAAISLLVGGGAVAFAAGTLTPEGSPHSPIQIRDHHVNVILNNGFARTEVLQTFHNPNDVDLEAIYSFPLPKSASLSEVTITAGEKEIHGEVLPRDEADRIYEEERDQGNDAGLASKNGYQTFEFRVTPVRARADTGIRFVYYQPLEIDTGVGRYLYPLEEGGTDDAGASFWTSNDKVEGTFSAFLEVKSAWPVEDVRVPGFEAAATIDRLDEGHLRLEIQTTDARLDRDLVIYYRLREDLPGRVEVIPYRAEGDAPGTFMMVVTPGLDLRPLDRGADYLFILDVSGSMQTKIHTLARGVAKALGEMSPEDRLRVVAFANRAREVTRGWTAATPANVAAMTRTIETLQAGGSTNLFAGLSLGLGGLDADRATSVILVTDGVTNTGVVAPDAFHKLMKQFDVRVFGFLMGNSANWPLMRTICDASGGFYAGVSNADDIIGQLLLAKSKITHECLHDAELRITGARVFDTTGGVIGKVYRGQQLVIFGRYDEPGAATFTLDARLTGEDRRYTTTFELPEIDSDNPEIERLWALSRIEEIEAEENRGHLPAGEARSAIGDLGVTYQLVTDHTSMIVLSDDAFEKRGIERRNRERIARERQAQSVRAGRPARSHRVDGKNPAFRHRAPSVGGGAVDPLTGVIALALAALAAGAARRRLRIARGEEDA